MRFCTLKLIRKIIKMKKTIFSILAIATVMTIFTACSGGSGKGDNNAADSAQVETVDNTPTVTPITRDIDFMIFLHRFSEDIDFQMQHIKFPLGKLSYAQLEGPDGYHPDNFTERYWAYDNGDFMRTGAPGYFTWRGDDKIEYVLNSSVDEELNDAHDNYTFEKIDGEWYCTDADFSGNDVGFAEEVASWVKNRNDKFRKTHKEPYPAYEYTGTPGDYPQASDRLLTEEDLSGMDSKQLRLMRNEIMARHGYSFSSKDLREHFNSQPWYSALFKDVSKSLSEIEKTNIDFIKAHDKK